MRNWIYAAGILLLLVLVGFVGVPAVSDHLNDQQYLTVWGQANTELSPLYESCIVTARTYDNTGMFRNFTRAGKIATDLSIRTKYWYDKLSPLPVSKAMQDSKNARMQALTEEIAFADGWSTGIPQFVDGKNNINVSDLMSSLSEIRGASEHQTRMVQYTKMANESLPK